MVVVGGILLIAGPPIVHVVQQESHSVLPFRRLAVPIRVTSPVVIEVKVLCIGQQLLRFRAEPVLAFGGAGIDGRLRRRYSDRLDSRTERSETLVQRFGGSRKRPRTLREGVCTMHAPHAAVKVVPVGMYKRIGRHFMFA